MTDVLLLTIILLCQKATDSQLCAKALITCSVKAYDTDNVKAATKIVSDCIFEAKIK